jgi:hypothetical protein
MPAAVEYTIIGVEPNHSGTKKADGTEVKQLHFLINTTTDLSKLPECLPGSTVRTWHCFTDPLNAGKISKIKDNAGVWQPE